MGLWKLVLVLGIEKLGTQGPISFTGKGHDDDDEAIDRWTDNSAETG